MSRLTVAKIKSATAGKYTDGNGLVLVVGSSGTRSWFYKSRIQGKWVDKKIGEFPSMSLSEARAIVATIKVELKNGKNYFLEEQKKQTLFDDVVKYWVNLKKTKGMKDSTLLTDKKRLNKHILPCLKGKPIVDISKSDLRKICEKAKVETPYTANRVAGMLQSIFEVAVMRDDIESSPAQYLTRLYPKPKHAHNPFISIEEIPVFMTDLGSALRFKLIDKTTYNMILIQFHTLSRPAEIAQLKWSYIDFDKKLWEMPAEIMKNKTKHSQPLSESVLQILCEMKNDSEYVFPSGIRNGKVPYRNKETANTALKVRMKYKGKLTAHGLRHTAATALGSMGYSRDLIDYALSHFVGNEVSRTYNHASCFNERRKMLDEWSLYLSKLTNSC